RDFYRRGTVARSPSRKTSHQGAYPAWHPRGKLDHPPEASQGRRMSAHKLLALFTAALLLYGQGARGQGQAADPGRAICGEVEKALDAFGRFGHTSCTPSRGSTPGAISLLLTCNQRVLAADETKKAWLLFSV